MNRRGKALALSLAAFRLLFSALLCAQETIGVAMPTQSTQRWIQDGANMKRLLEERGYGVDLQYAETI